ncbi:MAG: ATP-binding protein [Pseudomonadota bacterium]|nr:ATP-binding protein [Pseudomonadota bacterium]
MKQQLTSWYLIRSYSVIAAGILIIALALDSLMLWVLPGTEQSSSERYATEFALIELLLTETGSEAADLAERFAELSQQIQSAAGVPVRLYEATELAGQATFLDALRDGSVQSFLDGDSREILYRMLSENGPIIALGPLPQVPASTAFIETMVIVSYYLLVALLLFLWIRPFYRDLSSLRQAASQFGRDDFQTRVAVSSKSSILPVANSFNKMAERIQYLVTAHRDLTNAVAHELRTPLARFKFGLEMIPKMPAGERQAEHLDGMKADVQELETLIDEMLSYAKLSEDNLQLPLHEVNLTAWLQQQVLPYRDAQPKVVLIKTPDSDTGPVAFNPDLLSRALNNVIRNCLRYAASEISVSCQIDSQTATLRVCDDGPGIAESDRERIFEPFARLDTSRDRQSGGYGLGLAITMRIMQRHGGQIHVESNDPHGACFVMRWPYN